MHIYVYIDFVLKTITVIYIILTEGAYPNLN